LPITCASDGKVDHGRWVLRLSWLADHIDVRRV